MKKDDAKIIRIAALCRYKQTKQNRYKKNYKLARVASTSNDFF